MEKVSIFVDVQNIYYTARSVHRRNFDYNAFWAEVTEDREVVHAFAYAVDRGDEQQRRFQKVLRGIGFQVRLKPYIQRADGSAKGDWDVGITIDVMEHARDSDVIVLASGDGDFTILVNKVRHDWDLAVEVYSVRELTAASLIHAATKYRAIDDSLLLG